MSHIAIDTCVFEHYLNVQERNPDHHIDQLLSFLQRQGTCLCVDSAGRVAEEYNNVIVPIIKSRDETGLERYVLSYWMLQCPRRTAEMDETDYRMNRIRRVIPEPEPVDRAFVYIACSEDCKLVSNDNGHIISRRAELRKATKGYRGESTDFLTSRQAAVQLIPPPRPN